MSFVFVSGDLALDLAGTLKWRRSDPEELLATPADLARWAVEAGVLSDEPPVDAAGLRRTRALREVVYRLVRHGMDGRPWPEDDLRELNRAAAGPTPRMALTPSGLSRTGDIAAVAAEVARAAIALLAGLDRLRVRECGHPDCTRVSSTGPGPATGSGAAWRNAATASRRPTTAPGRPDPSALDLRPPAERAQRDQVRGPAHGAVR